MTKLPAILALAICACGTQQPAPAIVPHVAVCADPWDASAVYNGGDTSSEAGINYTANWWTQGDDPATHSGAAGSGQPWTPSGTCGGATTPVQQPNTKLPPCDPNGQAPVTADPNSAQPSDPNTGETTTPVPTPAGLFIGPYKDVTINANWNTDVISTSVAGAAHQPVVDAVPWLPSVTWAFATGECGSENWGGIPAATLAAANVAAFDKAGIPYVLSTGGAAGSFTCGSDAGFETFIARYASAHLAGVDFDIEAGQSDAQIADLVARVKSAKAGKYGALRYSFTVATLGGDVSPILGVMGVKVVAAAKAAGLTDYYLNLMAMDYGSPGGGNCVVGANGECDMGASAVQAAKGTQAQYGIPYDRIEVTPMIGGNDTAGEVFTLQDVATLKSFAAEVGLAGLHWWSLDRDVDCAAGSASPTCNSYGKGGTLGFAKAFTGK